MTVLFQILIIMLKMITKFYILPDTSLPLLTNSKDSLAQLLNLIKTQQTCTL